MTTEVTTLRPEQFEALTKEQAIELLIVALQAQEAATRNMQTINGLLEQADSRIRALESQNQLQEAELIVLRSRP